MAKEICVSDISVLGFNLDYATFVLKNENAKEERNSSIQLRLPTSILKYRIIGVDSLDKDDKIYLNLIDKPNDEYIDIRTTRNYVTFFNGALLKLDNIFYFLYSMYFTNPSLLKPSFDIIENRKKAIYKRLATYNLNKNVKDTGYMLIVFYNIINRLCDTLIYEDFNVNLEDKNTLQNKYNILLKETDRAKTVSTITYTINKTNIITKGQGKYLIFSKKYKLDDKELNNIYLQMYLDICMHLKVTPFRYICKRKYLEYVLNSNSNPMTIYEIQDFNEYTNKRSSASCRFNVVVYKNLGIKYKKYKIPVSININLNIGRILQHINKHDIINGDSFSLELMVGNEPRQVYLMKDIGANYNSFDMLLLSNIQKNIEKKC